MISFKAEPFTIGSTTILKLPDEASAKLPSRGMVMVKGTINDASFQLPLEPDGKGSHWFKVDKTMRESAGVGTGRGARLSIEPTKEWPEPDVPEDVRKALDADPEARAVWQDVTPMARWDWLRWIVSTRNPQTRERRIAVARSKLKAGTRRPCCFNRAACTDPYLSKNAVLMEPAQAKE